MKILPHSPFLHFWNCRNMNSPWFIKSALKPLYHLFWPGQMRTFEEDAPVLNTCWTKNVWPSQWYKKAWIAKKGREGKEGRKEGRKEGLKIRVGLKRLELHEQWPLPLPSLWQTTSVGHIPSCWSSFILDFKKKKNSDTFVNPTIYCVLSTIHHDFSSTWWRFVFQPIMCATLKS